jgi:ABC-2 type transport system permease protein
MTARRTFAVARRIVAGFLRDHRTLALLFIVPIVISALLGWIVREGSAVETRIVIANEAGAAGEPFVAAVETAADGLDPALGVVLLPTVDDAAAARAEVEAGDADVALVLPVDLGDGTGQPTVVVVTRGTDPAQDAARLGAVRGLLVAAAASVLPPALAGALPDIEHETIYLTPEAGILDVLAPVFLGYFAYFFVYLLTGISFLRERIGGTLERLLATPVTRADIVAGYGLGFGIFATLQVIVLTAFLLMAIEVPAIGPLPAFTIGLGVPSAGSPILTFAVALLLAIGAVNLGILLSTFARTELQIIQFIPIVIVPQGLLCGIFWPIEQLPELLQPVARLLPLTYAVEALRAIMLEGADLASSVVRWDILALTGFAVVFAVLATLTIKREIV